MMLIKKLSFVRKIRKWKTVFWIRDPWMRRAFENMAEAMGVSYEAKFDSQNNRMAYIILDIRDDNVEGFLKAYLEENTKMSKYFHQEVLGVRFVNIAEESLVV